MLKNIYKKIIAWFFISFWFFSVVNASISDIGKIEINRWTSSWWTWWPEIHCNWLPWCKNWTVKSFLVETIELFVQIVVVLAVFALIFSWIMYMISAWDEEKINKAKRWILWSLIWVFLSSTAWSIIFFLNNIKF